MTAHGGTPPDLARNAAFRRVARFLSRRRRPVAAALAAAAVACGLAAARPPAPDTVAVLVAAEDLPGGARLGGGSLTTTALPPRAVPDGALRPGADISGRVLRGPVRAGEPITDVRLAGNSQAMRDGFVATPVRIADAAVGSLLHAGDRVDVLAADTRGAGLGEPAGVIASGVRVLAVPSRGDGDQSRLSGAGGGGLVLLATTEEQAAELASAAVTSRLSVTVRAG